MREKIDSLERRLNATTTDGEDTGESLRLERYPDVWQQNGATTASSLIPGHLPDVHGLLRRSLLRSQGSDTSLLSLDGDPYEWNEGADDEALCTDAMGAASARECKPGFFGEYHFSAYNFNYLRWVFNVIIYGRNQSVNVVFYEALLGDEITVRRSPPSSLCDKTNTT